MTDESEEDQASARDRAERAWKGAVEPEAATATEGVPLVPEQLAAPPRHPGLNHRLALPRPAPPGPARFRRVGPLGIKIPRPGSAAETVATVFGALPVLA
ncbi:hypothetical protein ACWC5I_47945 [Kitasatospora sp. NPDC001574]